MSVLSAINVFDHEAPFEKFFTGLVHHPEINRTMHLTIPPPLRAITLKVFKLYTLFEMQKKSGVFDVLGGFYDQLPVIVPYLLYFLIG